MSPRGALPPAPASGPAFRPAVSPVPCPLAPLVIENCPPAPPGPPPSSLGLGRDLRQPLEALTLKEPFQAPQCLEQCSGGAAFGGCKWGWSCPAGRQQPLEPPFPSPPPSPRALQGSLPENKRKHSPSLRAAGAEVKGQLRSHILEAKSPRGRPAASSLDRSPRLLVPFLSRACGQQVCPRALTEALSGLESLGGESPGLRPLDSARPWTKPVEPGLGAECLSTRA